eukprot:CAMPEP_0185905428 /NCGR_PEP_ID=MMETSP0196C-20130402/4632_1 /TAXON_ID=2932 /ORGANISM="Alexandrium fundyense, Strain CCMP1719" /LENGTH=178 /DNA_ID=CAMNT_0028624947 /DNA_START=51 /DNA_END=584 /DNA_ORIENTATION=+
MSTEADLHAMWPAPKRCAMVSSSRTVLQEEAGRDIDACDGPVMRLNLAPSKGFESHVGSRTDIVLVNDQIPCYWMDRNEGPAEGIRAVIINDFGNMNNLVRYECVRYLVQGFPSVKFFAVDFEAMNSGLKHVMEQIETLPESDTTPLWATSGLVAGMSLLGFCEELFHYGFIHSENCR